MQLLNITNFFQIHLKDDENELSRDIISALCNLVTFNNTFETPSDVEQILEKTNNPSSNNIKKVMKNIEKEAEQVKIKNITSQSKQTN